MYGIMSGRAREAFSLNKESAEMRDTYGRNTFGQCCLLARRLVGAGVRFVTINTFLTVFDEITWDIHGSAPFSPIECYSDLVCPMFDKGYASLLEDLKVPASRIEHVRNSDNPQLLGKLIEELLAKQK